MSLVILSAVSSEFVLLLINKHGVTLFHIVDLKVQTMNVALHLGDVGLSGNDSSLTIVGLSASHSQLFIKTSSPIDECHTFFL